MDMDEFSAFLELAGMLVTDPRTVVLFGLLLCAAVTDVRSRRIPNKLTAAGAGLGLLYSAFVPFWGDHGLLWSLGGCMAALVLLFPLWMLRVLGAGDVKLMAMTGALVGLDAITGAMVASLIAGGLLAVGYSLWHGKLRLMFANVGRVVHQGTAALATRTPLGGAMQGWESVGKLPFGVAIAAGTIASVVGRHFGLL
jgi:prepilin peptidase CpaA